jgi:hypothetical protein
MANLEYQGCRSSWTWPLQIKEVILGGRETGMLVCEHECMSRMEFSLEYFIHANRILGEYFLTRKTEPLLMWRNILLHVYRLMIFMDEKNG